MTLDEYFALVPEFQKRLDDKDKTVWDDIKKARDSVEWPPQVVTVEGEYFNNITNRYETYKKQFVAHDMNDFLKKTDYFYTDDKDLPGLMKYGTKIKIIEPKKVHNV